MKKRLNLAYGPLMLMCILFCLSITITYAQGDESGGDEIFDGIVLDDIEITDDPIDDSSDDNDSDDYWDDDTYDDWENDDWFDDSDDDDYTDGDGDDSSGDSSGDGSSSFDLVSYLKANGFMDANNNLTSMTDAQLTELLNHVSAQALYAQIIKILDMSNPTQLTEAELDLLTFATIHIDGTILEISDSWGVIDNNYFYIDNKGFLVIIPKATFEQPTYEEIPVPEEVPEDEEVQESEDCDGTGTTDCEKEKDDPCLNSDLRHKKIEGDIAEKIDERTQVADTGPNSSAEVKSFKVQDMEDGWGDINLDRYELQINKLPNNISAEDLFNDIRKNFADFVTGGNSLLTKVEVEPYSDIDATTWASDNPLGAAMDFNTLIDDNTIICTEYSSENMTWTFTTYTSIDHMGHFVAGHRQFGMEQNSDGSYNFFLRGADRLWSLSDVVGNELNLNSDFLYVDAQDATWKNVMEALQKYIEKKPGSEVETLDKNKDYAFRHEYNKDDCK